MPDLPRFAIRLVRFVYAVLRDAIAGNLPMRAMGLVYVTILSIVPVIAISFSVLKGFGFHKRMEPLLYTFLEPLGERGVELTDQVIGFVDNVQGDVLAGVGLLLLFFTTISMAQKVEESFNFIWRVEQSRNLAQRISEFLSVILVGPVIMVTALGLMGMVSSNTLVQEMAGFQPIGATLLLVGKLAPYAMVILGFSFAYWFLPNTRVKLTAALVGGLVGGLLWSFGSALFTTFIANSARTLSIYATFAIVIIALIWLYFCWLILMVGAQVAFYFQHPEHLRLGYRRVYLGSRQREQIALSIMGIIARSFRSSNKHPRLEEISREIDLSVVAMVPTLERLQNADLITRTEKNELIPNRDPREIKLVDVIAAVREPQAADVFPEGRWPTSVQRMTQQMNDALLQAFGDKNVYDLVDEPVATAATRLAAAAD
ncbi:MAG: YhjD/YihY/BrkB family envelope integrity protein [Gammaproteobacteria bacterium]|nr:YhjD/YihY/BrkB family envelope integrity protein [Gammaproteobacteria bacterium]